MEISVKQMMQIENNGHDMGFLKKFMMENAGASAVRILRDRFEDLSSKKVLIFAGLGNNGGDALVMSRHLAGYGSKVRLHLLGDPQRIKTEESQWNWELLNKMNSLEIITGNDIDTSYQPDIIVDGILGTGITGEIKEPYSSAMDFINSSAAFKVAVDVPSGLNPDNGENANKVIKADLTVTFHKMKEGMPKRTDVCGKIYVEKIGIPPEAEKGVL